jgi:hypothetical protein
MFRFVGWLVVTGFAIYGAVGFIKAHVVVGKDDCLSDSG